MTRRKLFYPLAAVLSLMLVGGISVIVHHAYFAPKTITAYFTKATAIYPGDEVRVAGVQVGSIEAIEPMGTQAKMTLSVNRDVPIPADATAVIVAQNLISARYVQLAPAYVSAGPVMGDGAVIPVERTAIPVEWDELKDQLNRLTTALGPGVGPSGTSLSRFIDSAANAMGGNGEKLRQALNQLAGVGRILADGSGNIVDTIKNLSTFISTLRDSNTQIVQFQDRLATLTSVLDGSKSDLDAALTNVSEVVGGVQRFIANSRNQTAEQVQRLANVTQVLIDHQRDLEQLLHVGPTAIANTLNIFDPRDRAIVGTFAFANMSNPVQLICSSIGAVENVTAAESSKLCADYLGPALRLLNLNYLPFPINPFLAAQPPPQDFIYSEPRLAPGGAGPAPGPPEAPPAVSAYTGLHNDQPPPPGYGPPPEAAHPSDLPGMLLPAPESPTGDTPLPAEAPQPGRPPQP